MTAIVMNTMTGAVSEYAGFDFHAITPTHAGSVLGLYLLGGDEDIDLPIVSNVETGKTLLGESAKKFIEMVYFSMKGAGTSTMTVTGEDVSYSYEFPVRDKGESRSQPGRGFRENYVAIGYSNTDGEDFQLDRIEVLVQQSKNRKV